MNNDSIPSPAANLPLSEGQTSTTENAAEVTEPAPRAQDAKTPAQKAALTQAKKRNELLGGMMEQLDMLIYVELCILYYMEYALPPSHAGCFH